MITSYRRNSRKHPVKKICLMFSSFSDLMLYTNMGVCSSYCNWLVILGKETKDIFAGSMNFRTEFQFSTVRTRKGPRTVL